MNKAPKLENKKKEQVKKGGFYTQVPGDRTETNEQVVTGHR